MHLSKGPIWRGDFAPKKRHKLTYDICFLPNNTFNFKIFNHILEPKRRIVCILNLEDVQKK